MNSSMNSPARRVAAWRWIALAAGLFVLGLGSVTALRTPHRTAPPRPSVPSKPDQPAPASPSPSSDIRLTDVTTDSGIAFRHNDGGSAGQKYLVEAVSAGLALFDYDGDGRIDIYFVNGSPLPPAPHNPAVTNALYRNEGEMHFRDVTHEAGVGDAGFGLGVAVGDYDNDGDSDLYVNNFGPNVLYRNNGDGTFDNVTEGAGVACGEKVGAGASFLDADGDGDLELYVVNYVDFHFDEHVHRTIDGFPCYPGPLDFGPAADVLYRNNGDGTFADVSEPAGISRVAGTGMGMVSADYDNDGDTDVFVVNDEMANFLFENDGSGRFEEVGVFRGLAYNIEGRSQGNMAVDCGDYDNDGWLDFFTTDYSRELPVLYRNVGGGLFEDATLRSGAGSGGLPHVNWGTGFADFDSDGDRDLFIACGHLDQEVHRWNPSTAFKVPNLLLMNTGDGRFVDISSQCGSGMAAVESSRGVGLDDLDGDGDLDVAVLNSAAAPTLIRNDTRNQRHWLQIQLRGTTTNRDGIGAHVRVTASGRTQLAEVHSGRSYQSHFGTRLHFGLGEHDRAERIEVRWVGGAIEVFADQPAGQLLVLTQGSGESL